MKLHLFALLAFACGVTACAPRPAALHGTPILPPHPAPNFTLTDQHGKPFELSMLRGSAVALYFGFTHCKDVCPQTLALLGKARAESGLPPSRFAIVTVTIDPKRDTPQAFERFFRRVNVDAIGLSGSKSALSRVYRAYGVVVQPHGGDIIHSDVIYVIDASGLMREALDPSAPPAEIAEDYKAIEPAARTGVH